MNNIVLSNNSANMFEHMEKAHKFACIMAESDIIPVHYRGKPANTFIAVQTAYRMNLDPMQVMQNTFVIGGKLGMNSTFAISLANSSGLFEGGIRYRIEGAGEDLRVTAFTQLKGTGEEISYTIGMREATAEGWIKNPKYKTLPELMLRYRAATLLIRTHAPEVLNGMHMVEEIEDTVSSARDVTPKTFDKEDIKETATNDVNIAHELMRLCKEAQLDVKEFAKFAGVDSSKVETIASAIENFIPLKDSFLEVEHAAA
jgi:hypothetical protein